MEAKLNQCNAAKEDLEQQIDTLLLDTPYRERMIKDLYKRLYSSYDTIVELEEKGNTLCMSSFAEIVINTLY